jgi:hypothetical protein
LQFETPLSPSSPLSLLTQSDSSASTSDLRALLETHEKSE